MINIIIVQNVYLKFNINPIACLNFDPVLEVHHDHINVYTNKNKGMHQTIFSNLNSLLLNFNLNIGIPFTNTLPILIKDSRFHSISSQNQ